MYISCKFQLQEKFPKSALLKVGTKVIVDRNFPPANGFYCESSSVRLDVEESSTDEKPGAEGDNLESDEKKKPKRKSSKSRMYIYSCTGCITSLGTFL